MGEESLLQPVFPFWKIQTALRHWFAVRSIPKQVGGLKYVDLMSFGFLCHLRPGWHQRHHVNKKHGGNWDEK